MPVKTFMHCCIFNKNILTSEINPISSKVLSSKGFNDTVFHHFLNELKHCNPDMQMELQLQSWSKYMRQTLLFVWNSTIQENFDFCYSAVFY